MFLEKIKAEGLAHLSYIVGDSGAAAVIDPRRDCEIYLEIAHQNGAQITHIFETHRNEDYVIGSVELANITEAEIYHGKDLPFKYGNPVAEGDTFQLGSILFKVLETPGHTYESISLVLSDLSAGSEPVAVFTGDTLFVGDVGRTDFFPGKEKEVAGLIYESIFKKLLPLGDHVIVYPSHGSGSVCGAGISSREFSTLGFERRYNPVLQRTDRNDFIRFKISEHHHQPPYFKKMEFYNLEGPPLLKPLKAASYNAEQFVRAMESGMMVLDVRSPEAFAGAFIPGSLAIPSGMIPAFAGFFLDYDRDIGLVVEDYGQVKKVLNYLLRLGYENVSAYLEGGMHAWEIRGYNYDRIPAVYAGEIVARINEGQDFTLLDVRSEAEYYSGHLPDAIHAYVGDLLNHLDRVPKNRPVTTFCGSGLRAIIAAAILKNNGFQNVENCLGSMAACSQIGCPIVT
jgi:hydroxyacylglutathione hydrolase